jgi:hypothetical protein
MAAKLFTGVWCEPDFRGRIPSMTVGDFANADPASLYAREVKATMAEAGLPAEAKRRFPARIRIGIPRNGLGSRLDRIRVWLDANCGANGWAMTPSGTRGVLNDALIDLLRGCR